MKKWIHMLWMDGPLLRILRIRLLRMTTLIMILLDVNSLFTNIPKDLVMNAIRKCWDAKNTKFNLTQFLYTIELILDSTCFVFDGRFYEQFSAARWILHYHLFYQTW